METILDSSVEEAVKWLNINEVVAIPTETVYGLAGNALEEDAVLKIFKAKERPHFNPLIVHVEHWDKVPAYSKQVPEAAQKLAAAFCPGPLTFLLQKGENIPDLVTAGYDKVAIRIPAHPLTLKLLRLLNYPLAAPSANRFGYVSPTTAGHVMDGLKGIIPYILDGGPCIVGLESTIVDFEGEDVIIRRNGGISIERIEAVLGKKVSTRTDDNEHPIAPGMLKSHYATTTSLFTGNLKNLILRFTDKKIALIEFGMEIPGNFHGRFNLSSEGNLDEAARNLFDMMRQADACGADYILCTHLPGTGLGIAINDRLQRATYNEN
jgi:L-threonylcarbamoyladenylate synthase